MKRVQVVLIILVLLFSSPISAAEEIPAFTPCGNGALLSDRTLPFDRLFRTGPNEYLLTVLEENSAGNYPANFDVDMMVSNDGITWTGGLVRNIITFSQTGNTFNYHVSILKDGNIYKAWSSATGDWNINYNDLYYSYSASYDNYTGYGLVLARGPDFDAVNIYDPHVIKVGNTYHLYYLADYGLPTSWGFSKNIAHATSVDGINWTKWGVVISAGSQGSSFDSEAAAHPVVIHDGSKFQMFYLAVESNYISYGVGYAVSDDGYAWTKVGKVDVLGQSIPVGVIIDNGIEKIWYTMTNSNGNHELYLAQASITGAGLQNTSPAVAWIGLKNSDDQGTRFDLRSELYINGRLVTEGEVHCIDGVTRNQNYAKEATVPFRSIADGSYNPGDTMMLKMLTRIGTNPGGTKCAGHNNAVGLRLYYDSPSYPSRFGAELSPDALKDFFMHSSSGNNYLTDVSPTGAVKYKDSSSINYNNGNPWKEIGTWSVTLP